MQLRMNWDGHSAKAMMIKDKRVGAFMNKVYAFSVESRTQEEEEGEAAATQGACDG